MNGKRREAPTDYALWLHESVQAGYITRDEMRELAKKRGYVLPVEAEAV